MDYDIPPWLAQVEFDPKIVAYEKLLDVFWSSHDPTQVFGQGPDVGDQYRYGYIMHNGFGYVINCFYKCEELVFFGVDL
jgi:hypothetical protein